MRKGFTIIELVIVLSIVAILSAVLIPQLINGAEKSKDEIIDIYNGKTVRMVEYAFKEHEGPIAIRYPRGQAYRGLKEFSSPIEYGKGEILYEGKNAVTLDGYTLVDVKNDGNVVVMYMELQNER